MNLLELLISTIWFFTPAYFANASPVLLSKFSDKMHPIDRGKKMKDGFPVLGKGKTVEGSLFGIFIGSLSGYALSLVQKEISLSFLPVMTLQMGILLGTGAIVGDIIASFVKRRMKFERGEPVLILDQLDFLLGGSLFASILFFDPSISLLGILVTPIIHKVANVFAWLINMKEVGW